MPKRTARFTESTTHANALKVDREAGVIYGVKVLGEQSKNGRTYTRQAMQEALSLYEGVVVNIDHNYDGPHKRKLAEGFGKLCNARIGSDGIYADTHYLKSHPLAESVAERAERFPDTFGLSHDAEGDISTVNGRDEVTRIKSVQSVDLVAFPATNQSLFESEQKPMKRKLKEAAKAARNNLFSKLLEMQMEKDPTIAEMEYEVAPEVSVDASPDDQVAMAFRSLVLSVLDDTSLDVPAKLAKLKGLLKMEADAKSVVSGDDEAASTDEAEGSDEEDGKMPEAIKAIRSELSGLKKLFEASIVAREIDAILFENNTSRSRLNASQSSLLEKAKSVKEARELIESWDLSSAGRPSKVSSGRALESVGSYDEERKRTSFVSSNASFRSAK